jgi:CheY-like chemotaxis protein
MLGGLALRLPLAGMLGISEHLHYEIEAIQKQITAGELTDSALAELSKDFFVKSSKHVKDIRSAGNQLNHFFDEILELVQLDADVVVPEHIAFDPQALLNSCLDLLSPVADQKGLDFVLELTGNMPSQLVGGAHYLKRIIVNLLSNALKFTSAGSVKLFARFLDEGRLEVSVVDTGMGISADQINIIFDRFSRLSPTYQGVHKGFGLGLYAVKQYLNRLSGDIDVSSTVGAGSAFCVSIPVDALDSKTPASKPAQDEELDCQVLGYRILLVEDSDIVGLIEKSLLEKQLGCVVDWAKTAEESLHYAKQTRYDFIFMDIGLPDASGMEATRQIRGLSDPLNGQSPIVALTAHLVKAEEEACLAAGMQAVLLKPIDVKQMQAVLLDYCAATC